MAGKTAEEIHQAMCNVIPIEQLDDRRKWRDEKLGELFKQDSSKH